MSVAMRAARVPLVALVLWAALAVVAPLAMSRYAPYSLVNGPGALCAPPVPAGFGQPPASRTCGVPLTDLYEMSLPALIADTGMRSAVLLIGAATIALTLGVLIGAVSGAVRRRAIASGAVLAVTGLTAAVPSFFVAYFLQIVAARVSDVLDSEFITTANAKGLMQGWIMRVHVLPHALPVALEGLGSGLRISVASLPIVEYIFQWKGIGYVALQSIASRDAAALTASALVLVTLFALLSFIADIGRPRFAYR